MRFKDFINEKWEASAKFMSETYEIFKNPSKSELMSIESVTGKYKSARTIILPNGDAYVFDEDYLHNYAIRTVPKLKNGVKATIMFDFNLIQLSVDEDKKDAVDTVLSSRWVIKNLHGFRVEYPNKNITQYVESVNDVDFTDSLKRIAESISQEK